MNALKISDTHEWRLDNLARWGLHFLPSDEPEIPLRLASRFENELLNAAKREIEAASGAPPFDRALPDRVPAASADFVEHTHPNYGPGFFCTPDVHARIVDGVEGAAEVDRDTDGELLIDWSPGKGRMLSMTLRADGRLSYAFTWDGEKAHGTAQMPSGVTPCAEPQEKNHG